MNAEDLENVEERQEIRPPQPPPEPLSGVTDPDADQLHPRLLDFYRQGLEADSDQTYESWGFAFFHSLSDEDAHVQRRILGMKAIDALDHYNEGCAEVVNEDYQAALKSFAKALELDPDLGAARFNHAVALERLDKTDEARKAWAEFLARHEDDEEVLEIRNHVNALRSV